MAKGTVTFADIARRIAGPGAPVWLADHLEDWSPTLRMDIGVHSVQPTRIEMRAQIEKLKRSASDLQKCLADISITEFLEHEGRLKIENLGGLEKALRMIATHADLTLAAIPEKGGAGRARVKKAISPKVCCAIMIQEIWKHFHSRYPGDRNPTATKAAIDFWALSGGEDSSFGEPLNGWRLPFATAIKTAPESFREEFCRHIRLNAEKAGEAPAAGT